MSGGGGGVYVCACVCGGNKGGDTVFTCTFTHLHLYYMYIYTTQPVPVYIHFQRTFKLNKISLKNAQLILFNSGYVHSFPQTRSQHETEPSPRLSSPIFYFSQNFLDFRHFGSATGPRLV